MMFDIILTLVYALILGWVIYRAPLFKVEGIKPYSFVSIFTIKVMAGVMLYLIYTYYYTDRSEADIYRFYDDSEALYQLIFTNLREFLANFFGFASDFNSGGKYAHLMNNWMLPYDNPMYNDNRIVIRVHALLRLLSFGSFNVHTVFFSFFSFTGLFLMARVFYHLIDDWKYELFFGVQLIPSVLFWSSGCLKEPILFLGLGVFVYAFFFLNKSPKLWHWLCLILSVCLIYLTKFYILMAVIPAALAYLISRKVADKYVVSVFGLTTLVLVLLAMNIQHLIPSINFMQMLAFKQQNFVNLAVAEQAGSIVTTEYLEPTMLDMFLKAPRALFIAFFKPLPWEVGRSPFILMPMLENIFFILSLAWIIWNSRRSAHLSFSLFCISFVIMLFVLVGISTPVLGGIVRYKVPALPFLWAAILSFSKRIRSSKTKWALT